MNGKYMLVDGVVVEEPDLMRWAMWLEHADRTVARTELGRVIISTVFLGLDHSFGDGSAPILFKTMIFGFEVGDLDQYQERYATLESAMAGHERAVGLAQACLDRQGPLITWWLGRRPKLSATWRRLASRARTWARRQWRL